MLLSNRVFQVPALLPRKSNTGYDSIPSLPPKGDPPLEIPKRAPMKPAPYKPSSGSESPKPPPKPDRKPGMPTDSPVLSRNSPNTSNENVFPEDEEEDDEPPPMIPQKTKTLRSVPPEPLQPTQPLLPLPMDDLEEVSV